MSDAARLARQLYLAKPKGLQYARYVIHTEKIAEIKNRTSDGAIDSAYAAAVSYSEAILGLSKNSISWSIVRLYYSCFYSIRSLLFLNDTVPFNCSEEMLLNVGSGSFLKGGKSSHHWNWTSIQKILSANVQWLCSTDSQTAYAILRGYREDVNYNNRFTDPDLHTCLVSSGQDIYKAFRSYRDDDRFFYTYLKDHLAISYPTKLIFCLDAELQRLHLELDTDKIKHIRSIWKFKDRCPIT